MSALLAEMEREYPISGLWANRSDRPDRRTWSGPRNDQEAVEWVNGQDRGWRDGDFLTFAVLSLHGDDALNLVGHVALKGGGPGDRVSETETAEIGYWTAVGARGLGVASAAVSAVTQWAFSTFGSQRLRHIKLVHNLDNIASCRVAEKAGYVFQEISLARPPLWFEDGHIHVRSG
jgi:RimJ/RimL family protein N-acetyltransferase